MSPSVGHRSPPPRRDQSKSPTRSRRRASPSSHRLTTTTRHRSPSHSHSHTSRSHSHSHDQEIGREHRDHQSSRHRERSSDYRELSIEKADKRSSGRDNRDFAHSSSRSRSKRSASPRERERSSKPNSGSPSRASRTRARDEATSQRGDNQRDEKDSVAMMVAAEEALEAKKKEEPSFELSGKLAAETNRVKGVTLLFNEPSDARKPDIRWRLYVFKGGEVLNEPLYIHRQSCYLFGRERRVADIPTDHPSCSKQHAVVQFRQVEVEKPDGMMSKQPGVCNIARKLGLASALSIIFESSRPPHYDLIFKQVLRSPMNCLSKRRYYINLVLMDQLLIILSKAFLVGLLIGNAVWQNKLHLESGQMKFYM